MLDVLRCHVFSNTRGWLRDCILSLSLGLTYGESRPGGPARGDPRGIPGGYLLRHLLCSEDFGWFGVSEFRHRGLDAN